MFEVASAFGTVGLSLTDAQGVTTTTKLNTMGRWIIVFAMFVGRVGPLTMAFAIGGEASVMDAEVPTEHISIG